MIEFGSVCSGIEAASVAWEPLGWRCKFMSEIDKAARRALHHHYPKVPLHGDFTTIGADDYGTIDLLVGGTPCQDFSIAGLRQGITGERGNLTWEFIELLKRKKPRYFIWENVPGFLSLEGGETARRVLDAFEQAGYVLDIDILDAQHHGLAQRRERVFVCGQLASDIREVKTISSALTILQCLVECLQIGLGVLSDQSTAACKRSTYDASEPRLSLKRRMQLFGLDSAAEAVPMLAKSLAAILPSSAQGPEGLASVDGKSHTKTIADTASPGLINRTESLDGSLSTDTSWQSTLGEVCSILNACITSTARSKTTTSKIYTCSQAMLGIAELIIQSPRSSPTFWSAASSSLTALEAFIDYAKQAGSDLFTDLERVHAWRDFIGQAERLRLALGNIGIRSFGKICPLGESLLWNPAPRREAGKGVAAGTLRSTDGGSDVDHARANQLVPEVAPTLVANGNRTGGNRFPGTDGDTVTSLIVMSSGQANAEIREDGGATTLTCLHEAPIVAHAFKASHYTRDKDGAPSLSADADKGDQDTLVLAFSGNDHGADAMADLSPTLRAGGHHKSHANGGVAPAIAYGIRSDAMREGTAKTPSADAEGRVRLRDPGLGITADLAPTIDTGAAHAVAFSIMPMNTGKDYKARETDVAQPLMAAGPVGGNQGGDFIVEPTPVAFTQNSRSEVREIGGDGSIVGALAADAGAQQQNYVAFALRGREAGALPEVHDDGQTASALRAASGGSSRDMVACSVVRRLTPRECERLQGFPDDYTQVPVGNKPTADGPRYKQLGNSMAVPVMAWLGRRIQLVEDLINER